MPPASIEPDLRARFLRGRLRPERLLPRLEKATDPGRPFVTLIGIKGLTSEYAECLARFFPEYERDLLGDPEVDALLQPYRDMGFTFGWTGYSDPSGEEHNFTIFRNPEAEARLRRLVAEQDPGRLP